MTRSSERGRVTSAAALALILLTVAPAAAKARDAGAAWVLSLPRGAGGNTTIAVENRCAGPHGFSIDLSELPWVELRGEARVRVAGGATVTVPARVETGERDIGAEDGTLIVRCETCAQDPLCSQREDRVPSRLRVQWSDEELSDDPDREAIAGQVLAVVPRGTEREIRPRLKRWRSELGLRPLDTHSLSLRPVTVLRLGLGSAPLGKTLGALQSDPEILWTQPVYRYVTAAAAEAETAPDPYASRQWGVRHIGAAATHPKATGRGIRIAVLDSGVDARHPDLGGRVAAAVDLVDGSRRVPAEIHGTAVAGVLAAIAGNGLGIGGVAPDAELLAARVCQETSAETGAATGDTVTLARGLDWASAQRAQVINISLAGPPDPLLRTLLDQLTEAGVAVVAAAGNHVGGAAAGLAADARPRYPAAYPAVLAVSSLGADGAPFAGALHGDWVELLAPGEEILTTVPGGAFRPMTGSSFAAPHASGALALLLERSSGSTPAEVLLQLRAQSVAVEGSRASGLHLATP